LSTWAETIPLKQGEVVRSMGLLGLLCQRCWQADWAN